MLLILHENLLPKKTYTTCITTTYNRTIVVLLLLLLLFFWFIQSFIRFVYTLWICSAVNDLLCKNGSLHQNVFYFWNKCELNTMDA